MTRDPISEALHNTASAAHDLYVEQDVTADAGLRGRVRRRRRGVVATGAIASVVLASVAGVGVAQTLGGDALTDPIQTTDPEPDPEIEIRYVDIPFGEDLVHAPDLAGVVECGGPAPEPVSAGGGFDLEVKAPDQIELRDHWADQSGAGLSFLESQVTYIGDMPNLPAHMTGAYLVASVDGVVVSHGQASPGQFRHFAPDRTLADSIGQYWMEDCQDPSLMTYLPEGDYDLQILHYVYADEAAAALYDLRLQGIQFWPNDGSGYWAPGSYDCEQWRADQHYSGSVLQCDPHVLPGANVDFDAEVATVPYRGYFFVEEFEQLLVSEPINVTIVEQSRYPGAEALDQFPSVQTGEVPPCDGNFTMSDSSAVIAQPHPLELDDLTSGSIELGIRPGRKVDGSPTLHETAIELTSETTVWVLVQETIDVDGWPAWTFRAIGSAPGVIENDGVISIDKFEGPGPVGITLGDMTWCDGQDLEDQELWIAIDGGATVTGASDSLNDPNWIVWSPNTD